MLTASRLREVVHYDPATGLFTNRAPRKKIRVGDLAGTVDVESGYVALGIDRKRHYGHRLAFLYMTGAFPVGQADHINGDRSDNRWANLRDVPRQTNQQNKRKASISSTCKLLGAYRKRDKWESKIRTPEGVVRLGVFDTAQAAHDAYILAKRKFHAGCTI